VAQLRELSALAQLDDDEAEGAADLLIESNLVERELPLRFTHPLIRGVVYSDLPPARRANDHKRAAQILFSDGSANDRVAAHLLRSDPGGDPWVVERLLEAASASLERGSAGAAATLYARASTEPPAPELRWRVLHDLGRAQMQARDFGAVDTLQRAITLSQDAGQHADAALLLGRLLLYAGQSHEALEVLDNAIAVLDPADDRTLELEATLIAAARLDHELLQVAEDRTEASRTRAGAASYGSRMVSAQLAYQSVISGAPVSEAVALARAALGDGELIRQSPGRPDAYVVAISMLAISDELDEAETLYAEAVTAAASAGRAVDFAIVCGLRCWTSWTRGRLRDAELQARDGLAIASESPELMAAVGGFATGTLANVLLDLGQLEQAEAVLGPDRARLAASSASSARDLLFASARLCTLRGEWSDAASQLEACGQLHERARIVNPALVPWRSELALVRHALGDDEGARALVQDELELAQRFGARRPIGVALRAAGMIEGGASGLQMLDQAADQLAGSPAQLEGIRTAVALGAALRRAGRRVRAREVLRDALDRATRAEAAPLADEAGRELAVLGSRPHSPLLSGVAALTPAERRVAEMAAGGLTNRQIAQALFVTRATVESQLHATYRKLGIGSREQLTRALQGDLRTG
jgi:DNA-binding NarL/FixJ family response regulator